MEYFNRHLLPRMASPYIHPYHAPICQWAVIEYVWMCLSVYTVCVYVQLFLEQRLLIWWFDEQGMILLNETSVSCAFLKIMDPFP